MAGGALIQHKTGGSDFGAGYRPGALPDRYLLRVRFAHESGVGGGVLFDMPQADRIGGAAMAWVWSYYVWGARSFI